ncbi:MAG: hypothetical protein ACYDAC_05790 [Candidatus Dormibacteria bacterium]
MHIARTGAVLGALTMGILVAGATPALAATPTVSVTLTSGPVAFANTLGGVQFGAGSPAGGRLTATGSLSRLDIRDATGTEHGWEVQVAGTAWTGLSEAQGADTSVSATGVVANGCDAGSTCVNAADTVDYTALTIPVGDAVPVTVDNADAFSGQGSQTVTVGLSISAPADITPGPHASLWTVSLVSGP